MAQRRARPIATSLKVMAGPADSRGQSSERLCLWQSRRQLRGRRHDFLLPRSCGLALTDADLGGWSLIDCNHAVVGTLGLSLRKFEVRSDLGESCGPQTADPTSGIVERSKRPDFSGGEQLSYERGSDVRQRLQDPGRRSIWVEHEMR
jgi:hypothetical protein